MPLESANHYLYTCRELVTLIKSGLANLSSNYERGYLRFTSRKRF